MTGLTGLFSGFGLLSVLPGGGGDDLSLLIAPFAITLREGVEAALVVGIVNAYLQKSQRQQLQPFVGWGIAAGLGISILVGSLFYAALDAKFIYSLFHGGKAIDLTDPLGVLWSRFYRQIFEGGLGLFAITMLSWMLVWMTQNAKSLKGEIEQVLRRNLNQGSQDPPSPKTLNLNTPATTTNPLGKNSGAWAVFSLVLIAVAREGIEVVAFLGAQLQTGWLPIVGASLGLLGAVIIGVALFQFGVKLNLRLFFQVLGGFLLLIVAGLWLSVLSHGDKAVLIWQQITGQSLCWSANGITCILGREIWDLHSILPDKGFPGVILKALLGYRDHLYALQGATYLGFLAIAGWRYRQALQLGANSAAAASKESPSQESQ